jgi:exodeoxyribonuclease VII large subunit
VSVPAGAGPRVFSVAEVAEALARVLREHTRTIWVAGEVTNFGRGAGGRVLYLTLRDPGGEAQVDATVLLWQTPVPFQIADGMMVRVRAKPEFFPRHGALRLHVYEVMPDGEGALLARIEALRRALDAEGLFSAARKRPLPFLPRRVGLITARDGAARQDVERTLHARCPCVDLLVVTALMQGPGCPGEVVRAIRFLDADPSVDVIIVARGGGSLEDLMGFNDERVARALAASGTPTVAAIGHERDVTIACQVADVRASTPTAAATLVVPDAAALRRELAAAADRARRGLRRILARAEGEVAALRARPCISRPESLVEGAARAHADLGRRLRHGLLAARDRAAGELARESALLPRAIRGVVLGAGDRAAASRVRLAGAGRGLVERAERSLELLAERLAGHDPTRPLRRGFALVTGPDGRVVASARAALAARSVRLRFADGTVGARVEESIPDTEGG